MEGKVRRGGSLWSECLLADKYDDLMLLAANMPNLDCLNLPNSRLMSVGVVTDSYKQLKTFAVRLVPLRQPPIIFQHLRTLRIQFHIQGNDRVRAFEMAFPRLLETLELSSKLPALRKLVLDGDGRPMFMKTLPFSGSPNNFVESLELYDCNIGQESLHKILGMLPRLQDLVFERRHRHPANISKGSQAVDSTICDLPTCNS